MQSPDVAVVSRLDSRSFMRWLDVLCPFAIGRCGNPCFDLQVSVVRALFGGWPLRATACADIATADSVCVYASCYFSLFALR